MAEAEPLMGSLSLKRVDTLDLISRYMTGGGGNTWQGGVYAVTTAVVGPGMLAMPAAVEQCGWMGIALLVLIAVVSNMTAKTLVKTMYLARERNEGMDGLLPFVISYGDIGWVCYGTAGRVAVHLVQHTALLGVGSLFLVLIATNLQDDQIGSGMFWEDFTIEQVIALVGLLLVPFAMLEGFAELAIPSLLGVIAAVYVFGTVIWSAVDTGPIDDSTTKLFPSSLNDFALAFSTIAFAFGNHQVFLEVHNTLERPSESNKLFNVAYLLVALLYVPLSVVAYGLFGDETESPVLRNLPDGWASVSANIGITLNVFLSFPIALNPLALFVERGVFPGRGLLGRFVVRGSLIVLEVLLAIAIPDFGTLMAFVGAVSITATVFILPPLFLLRLGGSRIPPLERAWNMFIIALGVVGGVTGIYASVLEV